MTPARIEDNFNIWDFCLTAEDMKEFEEMNVGWRHLLWAETSMHPDYPFKVTLLIMLYELGLRCGVHCLVVIVTVQGPFYGSLRTVTNYVWTF